MLDISKTPVMRNECTGGLRTGRQVLWIAFPACLPIDSCRLNEMIGRAYYKAATATDTSPFFFFMSEHLIFLIAVGM